MDQPTIGRLLRIMKMLTANNMYTIEDMANRLNVSPRTVYRYIESFREAGFLIKRRGNYMQLDKSSPYFRDISELVHFTDEEAYVLKSAIESIDENNLWKQNLKKKLYTVYDYKILADTIIHGKDARNVTQLISAIENGNQVILQDYSSAHGSTIRDRKVEPFAFTTNYVQVWCYDLEEQTNKLFKTSRISSIKVLNDEWQFTDQHQQGYIDIFRISSDQLYPIVLELNLRAASLLNEEYPLAAKYLEKKSDNKWILSTNVCSFEGVGRFITGLWEDVEVIESDDLKEYLQNRLERWEINIPV